MWFGFIIACNIDLSMCDAFSSSRFNDLQECLTSKEEAQTVLDQSNLNNIVYFRCVSAESQDT